MIGSSATPSLRASSMRSVDHRSAAAAAHHRALVGEGGHGHAPAAVDLAEHPLVRHPHVGEEHLAEVRRAGHLPERAHLDARRVHVDEEVGDPAVLRLVRVGAGQEDAEVAVLRAGRPHLLTVHHPLVTVAHGPGGEPGEVAAGARLAEELAPHLVAAQHRREVALALLVRAVGDDGRPRHGDADGEGVHAQPEPRRLLGEDRLLARGAAAAAGVLRPGDPRPPVVGEVRLPRLRPGDPVASSRALLARTPRAGSLSAAASSQPRASARKAASSGLSSKSTVRE